MSARENGADADSATAYSSTHEISPADAKIVSRGVIDTVRQQIR